MNVSVREAVAELPSHAPTAWGFGFAGACIWLLLSSTLPVWLLAAGGVTGLTMAYQSAVMNANRERYERKQEALRAAIDYARELERER